MPEKLEHLGIDHLAIAVPDTEAALKIWRDQFGFAVLYAEKVNGDTTLLTHLDLGNAHLQIVQPLTEDHPLQDWLRQNGPGLHHFCLKVANIGAALEETQKLGLASASAAPHQGTQGKRALFLDKSVSMGVQVELTGE